jgi:hypothetical protein
VPEHERLRVAIKRGEPPPHVADAGALDERPVGRQAHAVVGHAEHQAVAAVRATLTRRAHGQRHGPALGSEPVLEGVLDERLEQEPRHLGVAERVRDVERRRQAVTEPDLLDGQVQLEHVALLGEGPGRRFARLQRAAEQLGELHHHRVGPGRVGPHHPGDGVEGVEQEVRPELHAQRLEPRLAELRREARGFEFARRTAAGAAGRPGRPRAARRSARSRAAAR